MIFTVRKDSPGRNHVWILSLPPSPASKSRQLKGHVLSVQYYRDRAREFDASQTPTFGKGDPVSVKKQNVGLLFIMAAAIGAVAVWNKNRKKGKNDPQKLVPSALSVPYYIQTARLS